MHIETAKGDPFITTCALLIVGETVSTSIITGLTDYVFQFCSCSIGCCR